MKKLRGILPCLAALVFAVCGLVACGKEGSLEIKLVDAAFREDVYVNREFDVMEIVENANDSWTYSLTECYYLDGAFERHDIETSGGTKFTPPAAFDVYCTLHAEDGRGNTGDEEFVLEVKVPTTEVQRAFIESWNDSGVVKTMTANVSELPDGVETGVKVSYTGTYNPVNDGVALGGIDDSATDVSLSSWENAVITMKIYNPNDFDLTFGIQFSQDNEWYQGLNFATMEQFNLTAGTWTDVHWSLRRVGLNFDIWAQNIAMGLKVRINSTDGMTEPYSYSMIICNMDIADYSAEKFPGLETRTDEEIFEQMPGDLVDKYLYTHTIASSELVNANYAKTRVASEVFLYADGGVAAPEGVENSASYVKYTVTPTGMYDGFSGFHAVPISFSDNAVGVAMQDEFKSLLSVEDWGDAYIGFWVYNASATDLNLIASTSAAPDFWGGRVIAVPSETWTYVEYSLSSDYGLSSDIFAAGGYNLKVFARYYTAGVEENWQDFSGTFYVDGFDIYNKEGEPDRNADLNSYTIELDGVKKELSTEQVREGSENSVKYSVGLYNGTGRIRPIYIANDVSSSLGLIGRFDVQDWSRAYVGFWVYVAGPANIEFNLSAKAVDQAGTHYGHEDLGFLYYGAGPSAGVVTTKIVAANSGWQYVEFDLQYCTGIDFNLFDGTYSSFGICIGLETVITEEQTEVFYIDGFNIYSKETPSENDALLKQLAVENTSAEASQYYMTSLTASVEANPCGEADGSESSVKYRVERTGTDNCIAAPIRLKNVSEDFKNTLSIVKNNGDWSEAYIGFWIYNDSEYRIDVGCSRAVCADNRLLNDWFTPQTIAAGSGWTHVEIKLSNVKLQTGSEDGVTTNLFDIPNSELHIYTWFYDVETENYSDLVFYIDGFDIYNK